MAIYGIEYLNEFKLPFPKKKKEPEKKYDKNDPPPEREQILISDQTRQEITRKLKSIVTKFNTDKTLVDASMEILRKEFSDKDIENGWWDGKYHKLGCKLFDDWDDYYLPYDLSPTDTGKYDHQSYNSAMWDVRKAICKELDKVLPDGLSSNANYGDGDEGIIEVFGFKD